MAGRIAENAIVEKNVNGEPWEFGSVSYEIDEFSRKFQNLIHRVR